MNQVTQKLHTPNINDALKSGLKFAFIGSFIGLVCVLLSIFVRSLLSGRFEWSYSLELLALMILAYPIALIYGGIPAFLTGFVLKLWYSQKPGKMIFLHAFWVGTILGSICIYIMFDGKVDSVIYLGLIPSALASVCCTYWFIIPSDKKSKI